MIRQQKLLFCAVLLCLSSPAAAQAATDCTTLPGRAGIDQYCESVPGAGGDSRPGTSGGRRGATLPRHTRSSLERSGVAGRDLVRLAESEDQGVGDGESKDKDQDRAGGRRAGGRRSGESSAIPGSTSVNPLSAVRSGVESGTSAGPVFLWVLLGVVVLFATLGWLRYRRRGQHG